MFPLRCTLYTCYLFSRAPFHPLPTGNTGEFVPTFPYCRCRLDRGRKTMTAPLEKNREPWIFPFFFAPPSSPSHSPSRNSPFCFIYSAGCWSVSFRRKKKKKGEKELGHFFFFQKKTTDVYRIFANLDRGLYSIYQFHPFSHFLKCVK